MYFFTSVICLFFNIGTVLIESTKLTAFSYPKFYKIVDSHRGMEYFAKKLGIDNYLSDYVVLKRTQPYLQWVQQFDVIKETVRNIDACSLKKTDPKLRAEDAVSEEGLKNCFEQCKLENKMYYQFLNKKLQNLIKESYSKGHIRLTDFTVYSTGKAPRNYHRCAKKGYKRYECECKYQKYMIKTSDQFKEAFHKIISDTHTLSASPENCKKLEETYHIPMKLIAFLIACHLMPTEVFGFLLWWSTTENIPKYVTSTLAPEGLELSEISEMSESALSESSFSEE